MKEQEATCIPRRARLLRIAMTAAAMSFGRYCACLILGGIHLLRMGGTHGGGKGKKGGDKKSFGDGSGFKARTPAEARQPMDAAGDRPRKPKTVNLNVHVHSDKSTNAARV